MGGTEKIVLKHVYYNMQDLIAEAKDLAIGTSLAVLKPKEVLDFVWKECSKREWDQKKLNSVWANQAQLSLFEGETEAKRMFKVVKKLPYEFSYVFTTEDGVKRTLMIEDWEVGVLYWNCLKQYNGDEEKACQKVKEKFFDEFVKKCDLYFFLGTTKKFHQVGRNPFIIIGTFYPKKEVARQLSFDF